MNSSGELPDRQALAIQVTTLEKLSIAVKRGSAELAQSKGQSLPVLSLLVRNLLELRIWTEFCATSVENAKRFQLDAIRDADDLFKAINAIGAKYPDVTNTAAHSQAMGIHGKYSEMRAKLEAALEPGELRGRYMDVRDAAEAMGKGAEYAYYSKVLSKFAHPTALVVMLGDGLDEVYAPSQHGLLNWGSQFALQAANITARFWERIKFPQGEHESGTSLPPTP